MVHGKLAQWLIGCAKWPQYCQCRCGHRVVAAKHCIQQGLHKLHTNSWATPCAQIGCSQKQAGGRDTQHGETRYETWCFAKHAEQRANHAAGCSSAQHVMQLDNGPKHTDFECIAICYHAMGTSNVYLECLRVTQQRVPLCKEAQGQQVRQSCFRAVSSHQSCAHLLQDVRHGIAVLLRHLHVRAMSIEDRAGSGCGLPYRLRCSAPMQSS